MGTDNGPPAPSVATNPTTSHLRPSFRRMRNWRVGIEARISHLKRSFGFRHTRLRRLTGAQIWAGLGVFAYNLQRMAVLSR